MKSHPPPPLAAALAAAFGCALSMAAPAAESEKGEPTHRPLTQQEVEAWLESSALPADISVEEVPEAPPAPPRDYGFVVEASIGALGHLGEMRHISPTAPWFHAKFGWEPVRWAMLIAYADVAFGNTRFASPPPEPRGYALYGGGGAVRFTIEPASWLGLSLQAEIGVAEVSEDILATYGFDEADSLQPYFGAMLGMEWYQVSPHYAIVVAGGARSYDQLLDRQFSSSSSFAWVGSAGLQYTF